MKGWGLHVDHPWSRCVREDGAPMRVYIRTPWMYIQAGEQSQVYDRHTGRYSDRYARFTTRPPR